MTVVVSSVRRVKSAIAIESASGVFLVSEEEMTAPGAWESYRFTDKALVREERDGRTWTYSDAYDSERAVRDVSTRVEKLAKAGKMNAAAEIKMRVAKAKARIATLGAVSSIGGGCERETSMTATEAKDATERLIKIEAIGAATAADAAKSHKELSEFEASLP